MGREVDRIQKENNQKKTRKNEKSIKIQKQGVVNMGDQKNQSRIKGTTRTGEQQ
jgi:hypothetical protein